MSHTSICHIPDPGVRPKAYMGGYTYDIPIIRLGGSLGELDIQFSDHAEAVAYCRQLARAAEWLADRLEGHHAETEMVKT